MDQKNKNIEFYVGILNEDDRKLDNFIKYLLAENIEIAIENHFDDPDGYYTYVMRGSWEAYTQFSKFNIVKSLSHYEE